MGAEQRSSSPWVSIGLAEAFGRFKTILFPMLNELSKDAFEEIRTGTRSNSYVLSSYQSYSNFLEKAEVDFRRAITDKEIVPYCDELAGFREADAQWWINYPNSSFGPAFDSDDVILADGIQRRIVFNRFEFLNWLDLLRLGEKHPGTKLIIDTHPASGVRPGTRPRVKGQPKRAEAERALLVIHPNGEPANVDRNRLLEQVNDFLGRGPKNRISLKTLDRARENLRAKHGQMSPLTA